MQKLLFCVLALLVLVSCHRSEHKNNYYTPIEDEVFISSHSYPLFKQCNSQWANNKLGTSSQTICQAGCLMSCSAMMINSYGVQVSGQTTNPGTLNAWLTKNGGYASGDEYVWTAVDKLGFSFGGKISNTNIVSAFNAGKTLMLNVHNGQHWVLMTGYSGNTLYVNDPGFSTTSYSINDVVNGHTGTYSRTGAMDIIYEIIESLFI